MSKLGEGVLLHAIIDSEWRRGRSLAEMAEAAVAGGCGVIQYRDKVSPGRELYLGAKEIRKVCRSSGVPFIVNDRVDVALAVGADGVHLGQEDIPLQAARRLGGEGFIIGISAPTVESGRAAAGSGADYLGVGAIFPTRSKMDAATGGLELLRRLRREVRCPLVAIGGIDARNVRAVIAEGVEGIAVISALLDGDIERNARLLRAAMDEAICSW